MVGKEAMTCRTTSSTAGQDKQRYRHLCRTEPSGAAAQPDSGDLFVTGFHCFRLGRVGNVSRGSSLAILPLFLMATWAVCRNDHHVTFVWGSQVDMTYGKHLPSAFFFPMVNTFLPGKTPLFVYLCY